MATCATKSTCGMLAESPQTNYGSVAKERKTESLEEVYSIIGVGKAQYIYWTILAVICYFECAELAAISTIVPILRCEWDLDILWESLINVSVYVFAALGGSVFASLPDTYGRKKVLTISLVILLLSASGSAIAQTKSQFLVSRCVVGISMGLIFPICITYSTEIVKSSHRETGPMLIVGFSDVSLFMSTVLAYFTLNSLGWRWYLFFNVFPVAICIMLLMWLFPESPRFLAVSDKKDEANKALQRIAKLNGVTLPEHLDITVHTDHEEGSVLDLLKSDFRKETILMSGIYFGNLLIIFGMVVFVPLAIFSGFCGGQSDPPEHECDEIEQASLLELSWVTFASVMAAMTGYLAALKVGRSPSLKFFSTASFLVSLLFFKCFSGMVTGVLLFLFKFLLSSLNTIALIVVPELYPTVFRNTAVSFINSWGRLGGAIGTGIMYVLYYYSPLLLVATFSASALLLTICSWIWNKETQKAVMQDVRQFKDDRRQCNE